MTEQMRDAMSLPGNGLYQYFVHTHIAGGVGQFFSRVTADDDNRQKAYVGAFVTADPFDKLFSRAFGHKPIGQNNVDFIDVTGRASGLCDRDKVHGFAGVTAS